MLKPAILLLLIASSIAYEYPEKNNRHSSCHPTRDYHSTYVTCATENGEFQIFVDPASSRMRLRCESWPRWTDLPFYSVNSTKDIDTLEIDKCKLPSNLSSVIERLKLDHVDVLIFKNGYSTETLNGETFKGLSIKKLYLYNNIFTDISENLFEEVPHLVELSLFTNRLEHLPRDLFANLDKLEYLHLFESKVKVIEDGTFDSLQNLKTLQLHIVEFNIKIVEKLKSLERLALWCGKLENLPEDALRNNKNLKDLDLTQTSLSKLPDKLLRINTKLTNFNLDFNLKSMKTLPRGFFQNLTELTSVTLATAELQYLPEDLFLGAKSLEIIKMNRNHLTTLPQKIFFRIYIVSSYST